MLPTEHVEPEESRSRELAEEMLLVQGPEGGSTAGPGVSACLSRPKR